MVELEERFWSHVARGGPNECWHWRGRMSQGYGVFSIGRRRMNAHRMAYQLTHGAIPAGLLVCHTCDTPACCNPRHLFLGTHADNSADMRAKGRSRGGAPAGERNPKAKLTDAQRARLIEESTTMTNAELARRYGISWGSVAGILKRARSVT
jgi:hypothetical protein